MDAKAKENEMGSIKTFANLRIWKLSNRRQLPTLEFILHKLEQWRVIFG